VRGVLALCGPGNNGADGLAVAGILHTRRLGFEVRAQLVAARYNQGVAQQLALARAHGVIVEHELDPALWRAIGRDWICVDALLGTGARGAPRGSIAAAITWLRAQNLLCVAIDVPSGVDPDSGRVPADAVVATRTITMQRSKPGLHITPGRACAGEVVIADIGLTATGADADERPESEEHAEFELILPSSVSALVRRRCGPARHKGERGHVAIVGGSEGTIGAAVLAGVAALRAGAGVVTLVSAASGISGMLASRPELMVARPAGASLHILAGALVVGPGLTDAAARASLARFFCDDPRPAIWDASALDEVPDLSHGAAPAGPRVITPHPGEAARMLSRLSGGARAWSSREVQEDRVRPRARSLQRPARRSSSKGRDRSCAPALAWRSA
jgi:NAD(P)H-hydrate epimerase